MSDDAPIIGGTIPARNLKLIESPKGLGLDVLAEGSGLRAPGQMCQKVGSENYGCQTELEFLTEKEAIKLGLPPETRTALHKCVTPGSTEGAFVPIRDAVEAIAVSDKFCECVGVPTVNRKKEVRQRATDTSVELRRKCAKK